MLIDICLQLMVPEFKFHWSGVEGSKGEHGTAELGVNTVVKQTNEVCS